MVRASALMLVVSLIFAGVVGAEDLKIGDSAPDFTAKGIDGKEYTLKSVSKDADLVVVCFTCNQCPVAMGYQDRLIEFNKKYNDKNVAFIALNCNNMTENLDAMKSRAEEKGYNFVYAFDASGKAAKAYGATVTPELFVIQNGKVAYHGSYDDDLASPKKPYLINAVNTLLDGKTPEVAETKPFGCGIKLK